MSESNELIDGLGRHMRDLRISITDRCNFRCLYCLPETEEAANFYRRKSSDAPQPIRHEWKPRSHFLTYEEITRVARIATGLGITKLRLTGGEPLLRRAVPELVRQLSELEGLDDLALTTNGFHFDPTRRGPARRRFAPRDLQPRFARPR